MRLNEGDSIPARMALSNQYTAKSFSTCSPTPMTRPSSFDRDALLACARGELFGPGNAKLPAPPMLMFDRITHISEEGGAYGKGRIEAELDVTPDLWFFDCHFIGDPVMPGCLGLDAMWQLVGFFLTWLGAKGRGRALGCGEIRVCGPAALLPDDGTLAGCVVTHDFDAALDGVDAAMMLRLQRERMAEGLVASLDDYHRDYGLTAARLRRAAPDAIVMHPGPMNRGVEIADDVADGPQSRVLAQVANGVAVRMAALEALLA